MKHALLSKNKIKFINGKITAPSENDMLFDTWKWCNNIVLAWISTSLSLDISQSTIYVDNVSQLWTDLHNRFSKTGHFRLFDLLQQIHYMSQGEKSMTVYFNELKPLWEDLETLRVLPTCTCGAVHTQPSRNNVTWNTLYVSWKVWMIVSII